jgi:uncharacterized iron-regulated membrane protein
VPRRPTTPPSITPRSLCLWIHRYVGLSVAVFLVIAGLTGSVLVFYHELDAALNPQLFRAPPAEAQTMDPLLVRERVSAQWSEPALSMDLARRPGEPYRYWHDASASEVFVDAVTGDILGARRWGDLSDGMANLMPFVYRLHYQLALGSVGTALFGVVALLWTVDCFVGLYLTAPPRRISGAHGERRSWLKRWWPAWLIRAASLFGAIFTFHRAAGLWLWALLLVFAWSAVAFNLRSVYQAVTGTFLTVTDVWSALPTLAQPRHRPHLDWSQALDTARQRMAEEAQHRGFSVVGEGALSYAPEQGLYRYDVHSSLDLGDRWPQTRVWFDGDSGQRIAFDAPRGIASGNTLTAWIMALHMGTVGGLTYRLLIVIVGLAVAGLSISGVLIWWRKRRRNRSQKSTHPSQPTPARSNHEPES